MAKNIMIQGTMSNAGKSLLCAGLCRIFKQDGYRVAPFKSQNMALNSYITEAGGEMGRAQVVQAEAAGIAPNVRMNPILLKPTTDVGSQVIVNGVVQGNMRAMEYYKRKREFIPAVMEAYNALAAEYDIIVIEGAGSPAEINLKQEDIVNMGLAKLVDAPVLLVGDIDRGGVFAQLYGTVALLDEDERARIKGTVVNKFRGDRKILEPGIKILEDLCGVPVAGVIPYTYVDVDDEDSLSERFNRSLERKLLDIAVIRLPRISNFTDFQSLALQPGARVRYAENAEDLEKADLIILPGTKNTIEDLIDLRNRKMDAAIIRHARRGGMVMGICGGYQMLGNVLRDPGHSESQVPEAAGLGLLDMEVEFEKEKRTVQATATVECGTGWPEKLSGTRVDGYEIHTGRNSYGPEAQPWLRIGGETDGVMNAQGNVLGTYLHGLFDDGRLFAAAADRIRELRGDAGKEQQPVSMEEFREKEFDRIAAIVRESVDMEAVYRIIHGEDVSCVSE